jgi:streptogramin lyase
MKRKVLAVIVTLGLLSGMAVFSASVTADPGERTYTLDEDFDEGTLVAVQHDTVHDQLQLVDEGATYPFIWVACSGRGTVVRIDVNTGEILGEYRTAPEGRELNPSRTTVDVDGNVWLTNRNESGVIDGVQHGSTAKFGLVIGGTRCDSGGNPDPNGDYLKPPFIYSTAVDRDYDGLIKTSRGLGDIRDWTDNGDGAGSTDGAAHIAQVQDADDECILIYQRLPNSTGARHVSVDANNDVWVGGYSLKGFHKLDQDTGEILASFTPTAGGYGGLMDKNGVIWSADIGRSTLLRYDVDASSAMYIGVSQSYGLGIDTNGYIWNAMYSNNSIMKIDSDGTIVTGFPKGTGGASNDRGVAVTPADDNVWVANSGGNDVSRLDNDGIVLKVIDLGTDGNTPTGVAVDANGKVWATCYSSHTAKRIDPAGDTDGLGIVDLTVELGDGAYPYNYSDMTGSTLIAPPDKGTWTVVNDSEIAGAKWTVISWTADEPGDSSIKVLVSSSEDGVNYGTPQEVSNEQNMQTLPTPVNGRYLKIVAVFTRSSTDDDENGVNDSPILYDLTKAHNQPPVADAGPDQKVEQTSYEGAKVTLDGSGSTDDGFIEPLTYTWTWDGSSAEGFNPTVVLPLGTTTVTLTVYDGQFEDTDTVDITVEDTTPPDVACVESVNPHGNNIPGKNRDNNGKDKPNVNPDGFYELKATDICDSEPDIYVGCEGCKGLYPDILPIGPFDSGTVVKFTEAPGAIPSMKEIGSANGQAGAVMWHITLPSEPVVFAVDDSGNIGGCLCFVPPPPW